MNFQFFKLSHISIRCLLKSLLKNLWMLVATALIFSMCTTLYLQRGYIPLYRSTATYAVMSRNTETSSYGSQAAATELSSVIAKLAETEMVRGSIREYSPKLSGFSGTITATQAAESNLLTVSVTSDSPETSFLAIQAFQEVFPTIIGYVSSNCVAEIIRNPSVSASPINYVNTSAASRKAAIIGAVLMGLIICGISIQRETIQTRSGARHLLDADIIASIHRVRRPLSLRSLLPGKGFSLRYLFRGAPIQVFSPTISFSYSEQINTVCTTIENDIAANGSKIFLITSVDENEGKSTIAGNLAAAMAMRGKRVALLDCDLRNPSINRFFGGNYTPAIPLNRLLTQKLTRETLTQAMIRHERLGLYMFLPTGSDKRCTELLSSPYMESLMNQLRIFDVVIVDTPPMGYFADTEVLMDNVDASMLVVRQDRTPACDINDAADVLRGSDSRFLGCILNDMTSSITEGQSYGYGYGYGVYGYGVYGEYGFHSDKKTDSKKK